MAEAESKSYYEEQENALNDLSGLLKTFLNRDDSPERVRIRKDYEAGAALTGKGGIRQRLVLLIWNSSEGPTFRIIFPDRLRNFTGNWMPSGRWSLKGAYTKHIGAGQSRSAG